MSYLKVKNVSFDKKNGKINVTGASSNVSPSCYHRWNIVGEEGYEKCKDYFIKCVFGGEIKFLGSCKSKAKQAYELTNKMFGLTDEPWSYGRRDRESMQMKFAMPEHELGYNAYRVICDFEDFRDVWMYAYKHQLEKLGY